MKLVLIVSVIGVVFALNAPDEAGENEMMNPSGCGNEDLTIPDEIVNNYITSDHKWKKLNLTYYLVRRPKSLARNAVKKQIRKAFDIYTTSSQFIFSEAETPESSDIKIGFFKGEHRDANPFNSIRHRAHAFPPGKIINGKDFSGQIHFNDAIKWYIPSSNDKPSNETKNVFNYIMHEIGHVLGLRESSDDKSVMGPDFEALPDITFLPEDDTLGLDELYNNTSTSTTQGPTKNTPHLINFRV